MIENQSLTPLSLSLSFPSPYRKVVSKTTNSYDGKSELNAKKVKSMVESYVKKYQEATRKDEQKKMKKELDNLVASKIG